MKKSTLTVQVNRNNVRVASFRTGDAEFVEEQHKRDAKGQFAVMAGKHLATKGFQTAGTQFVGADPADNVIKYSHPVGAKVELQGKGEVWLSTAPGKLGKQGTGLESLQLLLSGTHPVGTPGPWVNTQKEELVPGPKPVPPNAAEHEALLHKLRAVRPVPTPDQNKAIDAYKGTGYCGINDCLRYDDNCADSRAKRIKQWLDKASTPEDITVYRGVMGEYAKILGSISAPGTKFVDRGIVSTTALKDFATGWVSSSNSKDLILAINVPAGSKAAAIREGYDGEHEVLLQAGSAMQVKSYDPKTRTLHVDLVQDHLVAEEETIVPSQPAVPVATEGPAALPTPGPGAVGLAEPEKPKKPKKKAGPDDPFYGVDTDALVSKAKELGYEEKPSPNGGIRRMRAINFMTYHAKKHGGDVHAYGANLKWEASFNE